MQQVEPKSNYERVCLALTQANFITMSHVQVSKVKKDGDKVTLIFTDDTGEEFPTTFTKDTALRIYNNHVEFYDKDADCDVTLSFFTQSKFWL